MMAELIGLNVATRLSEELVNLSGYHRLHGDDQ